MVRLATLGKIVLGLTFPMVGAAYYTQYKVKCKITLFHKEAESIVETFHSSPACVVLCVCVVASLMRQSYYAEALALLKGYEPVVSRLGEPIEIKPLDISDKFNYQDEQRAQVSRAVYGAGGYGLLNGGVTMEPGCNFR